MLIKECLIHTKELQWTVTNCQSLMPITNEESAFVSHNWQLKKVDLLFLYKFYKNCKFRMISTLFHQFIFIKGNILFNNFKELIKYSVNKLVIETIIRLCIKRLFGKLENWAINLYGYFKYWWLAIATSIDSEALPFLSSVPAICSATSYDYINIS